MTLRSAFSLTIVYGWGGYWCISYMVDKGEADIDDDGTVTCKLPHDVHTLSFADETHMVHHIAAVKDVCIV